MFVTKLLNLAWIRAEMAEKVTLEIKAQISNEILDAFKLRMEDQGFDSKAEWLREQIRKFLFG